MSNPYKHRAKGAGPSCPHCGGQADQQVLNSRMNKSMKRRRRECHECGERFTTYEMSEHEFRRLTGRGELSVKLAETIQSVLNWEPDADKVG